MNYLNARYYNTLSGRFISEDPEFWSTPKTYLTDPQQWNSYSYARNNPISLEDRSGKCLEDLCIGEATIGLSLAYKYAPEVTSFLQEFTEPLGQMSISDAMQAGHASLAQLPIAILTMEEHVPPSVAAKQLQAVEEGGKLVAQKMKEYVPGGIPGLKPGDSVPNGYNICRGGTCTKERFTEGAERILDNKLYGVSGRAHRDLSPKDLSQAFPNKQFGFVTSDQINTLGGEIKYTPSKRDPLHVDINGLTAKQLSKISKVTKK